MVKTQILGLIQDYFKYIPIPINKKIPEEYFGDFFVSQLGLKSHLGTAH